MFCVLFSNCALHNVCQIEIKLSNSVTLWVSSSIWQQVWLLTQSALKITKSAIPMLVSLIFKHHGCQLLFFFAAEPTTIINFPVRTNENPAFRRLPLSWFARFSSFFHANVEPLQNFQLTAFTLSSPELIYCSLATNHTIFSGFANTPNNTYSWPLDFHQFWFFPSGVLLGIHT